VYACANSRLPYMLEMWRLLDRKARLIPMDLRRRRIISEDRKHASKSLLRVVLGRGFSAGCPVPALPAIVFDDNVDAWDMASQASQAIVRAEPYAPYARAEDREMGRLWAVLLRLHGQLYPVLPDLPLARSVPALLAQLGPLPAPEPAGYVDKPEHKPVDRRRPGYAVASSPAKVELQVGELRGVVAKALPFMCPSILHARECGSGDACRCLHVWPGFPDIEVTTAAHCPSYFAGQGCRLLGRGCPMPVHETAGDAAARQLRFALDTANLGQLPSPPPPPPFVEPGGLERDVVAAAAAAVQPEEPGASVSAGASTSGGASTGADVGAEAGGAGGSSPVGGGREPVGRGGTLLLCSTGGAITPARAAGPPGSVPPVSPPVLSPGEDIVNRRILVECASMSGKTFEPFIARVLATVGDCHRLQHEEGEQKIEVLDLKTVFYRVLRREAAEAEAAEEDVAL